MPLPTRYAVTILLISAYCLIPSPLAYCGIMLAGVPESNYVSFANLPQFDSIGKFTGSASGTLIAPNLVLTAGHLGTGLTGFQIRGTGTVYGVAEVIQHPTFVSNAGDINFGFDLQVVRLSTNVVGVTPASIYRGTSEVGSEAAITGFGAGGFGDVGATLGGAQRAGTNAFDAVASFASSGTKTGALNSMLLADFDSGVAARETPRPLEYHLAGGDSGGGVFIFDGGQWFLAGVNSGVQDQRSFLAPPVNPLHSDALFGYGAISYITRVSSFTGFIDGITAVPEPSSLALVGLIAAVAFKRRIVRVSRKAAAS
jgi:hypothetical protein